MTLNSLLTNLLEALVLGYFVAKCQNQRISIGIIIIITSFLLICNYYHYAFYITLIGKAILLVFYSYYNSRSFDYFFICIYACILIFIGDSLAFIINQLFNISYSYLIPSSKLISLMIAYFINNKIASEFKMDKHPNPLFDLTIVLLLIIYSLVLQIFIYEQYLNHLIFAILITFTIFIGCFFLLYHQGKQNEIRKHELQLLNQEYKFQQKNISQIKQTIFDVSKIKHDLNYLLLSFKESLEHHDYDSINQQINQQLSIIKLAPKIINTGNQSLDNLIMKNIDRINALNINFQTNYDQYPIPLEQLDLYIVVGNLLDNAIEHCDGNPTKQIIINRGIKNNYYCIKIKNTITTSPTRYNFKTTKTNSLIHGLGLKNVNAIILKYHGKIIFDEDDDYLSCSILLPIKTSSFM